MDDEIPLTVRTLKLVSIISTVVVISVAGIIAYSGYSEVQALASEFQGSGNFGNISTNSTSIAITGINIPNRMALPLGLTITASAFVAGNISLATATSNSITVQPGRTGIFNLGVAINMTNVFSHQSQLRQILFNGTQLSLNLKLSAAMVPFVTLNVSKSIVQSTGAMLGGFTARFNTGGATVSGQYLLVPMQMSWLDTSFMSASGTLDATITQMPGQPAGGNYGSGSTSISVSPGPGSTTLTMAIPLSDLGGGTTPPSGQYTVLMNFHAFGQIFTFTETLSV